MPIEQGETVPDIVLKQMTPDGIRDISTEKLLQGRKVILFGLPGAYTPVCSTEHLPGFIEEAEKLKAEGVEAIACVSINDPFVMAAWGKMHGAAGKMLMLSDPDARLTTVLGMGLDLSDIGLGTRSQRCSMVVENCVAQTVNVESSIFDHDTSSASKLLAPATA